MKRFLILCSVWLLAAAASAQDSAIPDGVFTAGTTAVDAKGRPWAYLHVTAPDSATLQGRELAVYLKTAAADGAGEFTLQGTLRPATNKALAAAYLDRAVHLGGDRAEIEAGFRALYRQAKFPNYLASLRSPREPGDPPWPGDPPQADEPVATEQIAMVVARGATDAELAETLELASVGSPAFALATGRAWAGLLPVAVGQPVTLELRLREGGVDAGVVGRIALVAGVPLPLPPPGAPVQVPDATPGGDLNIHLRWATPPELRRYALLSSGYNVYRVDKLLADSGAIGGTEEVLELLDIEPDKIRRLNRGSLIPPELFTEATVDPITGPDRETKFITDDNGRYERDLEGQVIGTPFPDCAEFAYYVTARDLLGRDGMLSPRGDGNVARRLAPQVPTGVSARADILPASLGTDEHYQVEVRWTPSASIGTPVARYEILRGTGGAPAGDGPPYVASTKLNFGANLEKEDPALFIPCGVLEASAPLDEGAHVWVDDAPANAPNSQILPNTTIWYAVRAVYESACGVVYSSPGPPAFAAFRPVSGPPAPPSQVCAQGYNPPLALLNAQPVGEAAMPHPVSEYRIHAVCRRASAGVTYAKLTATASILGFSIQQEQTIYFPEETGEENDEVSADFVFEQRGTVAAGVPINPVVTCVAGTNAGVDSRVVSVSTSFLPAPGAGGTRLTCRQVSFLAIAASLGSPPAGSLRQSMLSLPFPPSTITPTGGGYTMARIPGLSDGTPVFLEARASGGPLVEVGGALVINGQVPLPPIDGAPASDCVAWTLTQPLPPFAACLHLRGNGDGSTAPVRLGLCAPAEAAQYRFYRQIGLDEMSLLAEGEVPQGGGQVFCEDDALPVTSAQLLYFGQFLDRNGNASPLVPLGECPLTLVAPPPVPTLHEPRAVVNAEGAAAVSLDWFCPPPGVERFEVFLEKDGASLQRNLLIRLPLLPVGASPVPPAAPTSPLFANPAGASPSVFKLLSARAPGPLASSPALNSFYTARVNGELGEGPEFHVVTPVDRNVTYKVWIRSIGPTGGVSGPSKAWDFTWRTPKPPPEPGVEPKVDWPARPLPEAYSGGAYTPAIAVNQQTFWNYDFYPTGGGNTFIWPQAPRAQVTSADPEPITLYQRGVLIGEITASNTAFGAYIASRKEGNHSPHQCVFYDLGELRGRYDPNQHLARKNGSPSETILPAVLYRRQVPSEDFPDVTGDVIQVSPLVQHIACQQPTPGVLLMKDPFIGIEAVGDRTVEWAKLFDAGQSTYYTIGDYTSTTSLARLRLYLLDTQPVIVGARYEYFVVRFDDSTGEIKETINAGTTLIGPLPTPPSKLGKPSDNRPEEPEQPK